MFFFRRILLNLLTSDSGKETEDGEGELKEGEARNGGRNEGRNGGKGEGKENTLAKVS